ncbi:hypothetical protein OG909_20040 [Streptomyces sp. NBC_01754]|uniref:hypothetical protein n=1 Tax=Streptomyces sp. NBC_01754 TaxID=2975930 RepID=UPI002DD95998|nr:hypothetical protein [Streptomyces sp. NBC_01754]WSC94375.1 hypothetical protein OG909_20040 [Streptomyces sp. NBC_01754]
MSQPVQPSNPPQQPPHDGRPVDGNPYAAGQPAAPPAPDQNPPGGGPAAPTGNPFAGQQPGQPAQPGQFGGGNPFAPAPPVRNNLGLGLLAAVVATLVAAGAYGWIIGATERQIGYAAVGVGVLVGFAASKAGGRNPVLPAVGAVLALAGVYVGQLLGEAIIATKVAPIPVTVSEMFLDHFDILHEAWKADADVISFVFFAIAGFAAFSTAKKVAG